MRIGIATDHGGFELKEMLAAHLGAGGHDVIDDVERGVAVGGSGVGASVCANKIPAVRAGLIHDHFPARQGVEDDHMNLICMGGRVVGPAVATESVDIFLAAEFSRPARHLRRLGKVSALEAMAVEPVGE